MVYIHVPFCESFCTYCGFYSEICRESSTVTAYTDFLSKEIERRKDEIRSSPLRTIYIGGGTPSVLPLDVLERIARKVKDAMGPGPIEEFTIEVNPEDITLRGESFVRGLLEMGVDRISIGMQSFDDGLLRWMNRRHDAKGAARAYSTIRKAAQQAGRPVQISIDLIFGVPGLDYALWEETLSKAVHLGEDEGFTRPDHISAYQLSIEEGSALERILSEGKCSELPEEECRRQYDILCSHLERAGYSHYEISNFALPGREAVHNSGYWSRISYVGLGPGAHSFDSANAVRSWNSEMNFSPGGTLDGWKQEKEHLTREDERLETLMLSLRTAEGLDEGIFRTMTASSCQVESQLKDGTLQRTPSGKIRISESHFFTCDEIIRRLA